MKTLLFAVLILPQFAFAALNGTWTGWAYWRYQGEGPKCFAQMKFSENQANFSLLGGLIDCDVVYMETDKREFKKDANGELILDGQVAGAWSVDGAVSTYKWEEQYNENTVVHVNMRVEGGHMDYKEQWIESDGSLLYDIEGRLFQGQ